MVFCRFIRPQLNRCLYSGQHLEHCSMRMNSYCLWYKGEKVTSGAVVSSTRVSNASWLLPYHQCYLCMKSFISYLACWVDVLSLCCCRWYSDQPRLKCSSSFKSALKCGTLTPMVWKLDLWQYGVWNVELLTTWNWLRMVTTKLWSYLVYLCPGEFFFDKTVNGFLRDLFVRWREAGCNHDVTIVFFWRLHYSHNSSSEWSYSLRFNPYVPLVELCTGYRIESCSCM